MNRGYPYTIVKKPNPVNYGMRLQLLKNNHSVKQPIELKTDNGTTMNKFAVSGSKNNTVKALNPLSYENYLNRKKANLTKKNKPITEPTIDCNCAKTVCEYEKTIYTVDNSMPLIDTNEEILLPGQSKSLCTNIVPIEPFIVPIDQIEPI
jgi:predicted peptidase